MCFSTDRAKGKNEILSLQTAKEINKPFIAEFSVGSIRLSHGKRLRTIVGNGSIGRGLVLARLNTGERYVLVTASVALIRARYVGEAGPGARAKRAAAWLPSSTSSTLIVLYIRRSSPGCMRGSLCG
jgi:hypothetical protein